ncbi:MAG: uncharacterized protein A8A55_1461 [Amphiamblys sp. WSBS2006]|nr:MAG: uncharacterized protein A8A55_1461 [Amphiamblys sp. WSBS2006]
MFSAGSRNSGQPKSVPSVGTKAGISREVFFVNSTDSRVLLEHYLSCRGCKEKDEIFEGKLNRRIAEKIGFLCGKTKILVPRERAARAMSSLGWETAGLGENGQFFGVALKHSRFLGFPQIFTVDTGPASEDS